MIELINKNVVINYLYKHISIANGLKFAASERDKYMLEGEINLMKNMLAYIEKMEVVKHE